MTDGVIGPLVIQSVRWSNATLPLTIDLDFDFPLETICAFAYTTDWFNQAPQNLSLSRLDSNGNLLGSIGSFTGVRTGVEDPLYTPAYLNTFTISDATAAGLRFEISSIFGSDVLLFEVYIYAYE